jgi:hypothetical protein
MTFQCWWLRKTSEAEELYLTVTANYKVKSVILEAFRENDNFDGLVKSQKPSIRAL